MNIARCQDWSAAVIPFTAVQEDLARTTVSFEAVQNLLREFWSTEHFRPLQQEAVEAHLEV